MATIHTTRNSVAGFFSERLGISSGLALTRDEIVGHLEPGPVADIISTEDNGLISISSADIHDSFQIALHRLGVIPTKFVGDALTILGLKYAKDVEHHEKLSLVLDLVVESVPQIGTEGLGPSFVDADFLDLVQARLGIPSVAVAAEYLALQRASERANPWLWEQTSGDNWKRLLCLGDLFHSESLCEEGGRFIDQRFIDYLVPNFERIGEIHWRQFEALSAEYFQRGGYNVSLGEGRNDGGVDVRAWKEDENGTPCTILVQCKRQKAKVGKVVVKALYADVLDENATSGMLVTTSSLEPGAQSVCTQRGYPISVTDRVKLREWINAMRTPGRGAELST